VGTSGSSSYVYDGISVTFESAYTISVFAKYIDIEEFVIVNFTQSGNAYFNIENGTIISNFGTITEPKIENYGNGWYRCSAKFTATATASVNYGFYLNNATDKSVHIWGAQVEQEATLLLTYQRKGQFLLKWLKFVMVQVILKYLIVVREFCLRRLVLWLMMVLLEQLH
jgi:hypothetical protein